MDFITKTEGRVAPWNKGKLLGQKPPLKLKEIWAIRIRLQLDHRARELALFNLAVDSKLRGCDLAGPTYTMWFRGVASLPARLSCRRRRSARCNSKSPSKRKTRSQAGLPRPI